MSGVTKTNNKKITYAPILLLFGGNVVGCLLVSLTITCLCCFCLRGFVIAIVKMKVYRYNELRSELVYRIELTYNERGLELIWNEQKNTCNHFYQQNWKKKKENNNCRKSTLVLTCKVCQIPYEGFIKKMFVLVLVLVHTHRGNSASIYLSNLDL
jgi:hypothetical protein